MSCVHVHTCVCVCVWVCVYLYLYLNIHTCTHTHTHTSLQTHTHKHKNQHKYCTYYALKHERPWLECFITHVHRSKSQSTSQGTKIAVNSIHATFFKYTNNSKASSVIPLFFSFTEYYKWWRGWREQGDRLYHINGAFL